LLRNLKFKDRRLESRWETFWQTWQESNAVGDEEGSLAQIADWFQADSIRSSVVRIRFLEAIPGVLLSVGIMGTFVGLVLGLQHIETDPSMSDQLLASVTQLIGGLNTAFMTSVCGIFLSLFYLCLLRCYTHGLANRVTQFQDAVGDVFPALSHEQWAARLASHQYEQLQAMKTLAVDIATSVSDSFGGSIKEHLGPMIADLQETVQAMAKQNNDAQVEVMQNLVTQFTDKLNESVGNQFDQLGHAIESITTSLAEVVGRLEAWSSAQTTLVAQTEKAAEVIGVQLPALTSFSDGLHSVVRTLADSVNQIEALRTSLHEQVETTAAAQLEAAGAIQGASKSMADSAGLLESAGNALAGMSEEIGGTLTRGLERFESNIHSGVNDILEAFDSKLADILGRFSGSLTDAHDSVAGLREHSQLIANTVAPATEKLAKHIQSLMDVAAHQQEHWGAVSDAIGEYHDGTKKLAEVLVDSTSKHTQVAQGLGEDIAKSVDAAREVARSLSRDRELAGRQFEALKAGIDEGLEKLISALKEATPRGGNGRGLRSAARTGAADAVEPAPPTTRPAGPGESDGKERRGLLRYLRKR